MEEDRISHVNKAVEKAKEEGVKERTQQNDKGDPSKSAAVEIAKEKSEKRKVGEKDGEWKKVARKTTIECSLSVINDRILKNSTTDNIPVPHKSSIFMYVFISITC